MPRSKVQVLTWGSDSEQSNGMLDFMKTSLFGGNVGHAAVKVTFPANAEGDRLIETYCKTNNIPFSKRTYVDPKPGQPASTAKKEEVYEVYWSWWPASTEAQKEGKTFALISSQREDAKEEWKGVPFDWDPKRAAYIQPEQRTSKGMASQRVVTFGPKAILHERGLDKTSIEVLKESQRYGTAKDNIESIELLQDKFAKKFSKNEEEAQKQMVKLSTTEKITLEKFGIDWKALVKDQNAITFSEINALQDKLEPVLKSNTEVTGSLAMMKSSLNIADTLKNYLEDDKPFPLTDDTISYMRIIAAYPQDTLGNPLNGANREFIEDMLSQIDAGEKSELKRTNPDEVKELFEIIKDAILINLKAKELIVIESELTKIMDKSEVNNKPIEVDDNLKELLNHYNEFFEKGTTWHSVLEERGVLKEAAEITSGDLMAILYSDATDENKNKFKQGEYPFEKSSLDFLSKTDDPFETRGLPPDGVVVLPIKPLAGSTEGDPKGLNVEGMLKQMVAMTDPNSKDFDLYTKNCSKTTDSLLEAGADQPYQKRFFSNKALGFFGNPQQSHNNAVRFQANLEHGKPNIIRRMLDFNPIERMGGALLGILADKKASTAKKFGAVVGGIALGIVALPLYVLRRLADPLGTLSGAKKYLEMATTNKFSGGWKVLQGALIVGASFVIALAAPMALVQKTFNRIYEAAENLATRISHRDYKEKEAAIETEKLEKLESTNPAEAKMLQERMQTLHDKNDRNEESVYNLSFSVKSQNPKESLEQFKKILEHDPNVIPTFSQESNKKILAYIQKDPQAKTLYNEVSAEAYQRLSSAQKAVESGNPKEWPSKETSAAIANILTEQKPSKMFFSSPKETNKEKTSVQETTTPEPENPEQHTPTTIPKNR